MLCAAGGLPDASDARSLSTGPVWRSSRGAGAPRRLGGLTALGPGPRATGNETRPDRCACRPSMPPRQRNRRRPATRGVPLPVRHRMCLDTGLDVGFVAYEARRRPPSGDSGPQRRSASPVWPPPRARSASLRSGPKTTVQYPPGWNVAIRAQIPVSGLPGGDSDSSWADSGPTTRVSAGWGKPRRASDEPSLRRHEQPP
jgi:hypothetical protein